MAGVDLEAASAKRDEIFAGSKGALKAAEYYEADKYAVAAEGYLTLLRAHPDHPEDRSIVERAHRIY